MWTSLGKSIGDFVEERFTSPLISSFALAWAAVNYKFFVILFSKESVASSFVLIGKMFPDWETRALNGFVIPLGIALFYLFVFPYPSQWVYRQWRRNLQKTDNIKQDYENSKRLTLDESRELRKNINELELAADQAATIIKGLRTDLQTAHNKTAEMEVQLTKLPSLEAALETAKAEKLAVEQEIQAHAERNSKMMIEATMAHDRLIKAENQIASFEHQARIANVQAFAKSVFESGANDRLNANQTKRLRTIFDETERGDREILSMYKAILNVVTPQPRVQGMKGAETRRSSVDPKSGGMKGLAAKPATEATMREVMGTPIHPNNVQSGETPKDKPTNKLAELMRQVPPGSR